MAAFFDDEADASGGSSDEDVEDEAGFDSSFVDDGDPSQAPSTTGRYAVNTD